MANLPLYDIHSLLLIIAPTEHRSFLGFEIIEPVSRPIQVIRLSQGGHGGLRGRVCSFLVRFSVSSLFYISAPHQASIIRGLTLGDLVLMDDGNPDKVTVQNQELINLPKYSIIPFFNYTLKLFFQVHYENRFRMMSETVNMILSAKTFGGKSRYDLHASFFARPLLFPSIF